MEDLLQVTNIAQQTHSIIMVVGIGGGGGNAVNHMYDKGIKDVSFMVCNTDKQALYRSPVPIRIHLGQRLTEGLGAGGSPERGCQAALESVDEIGDILRREGIKMVFITAGMGGGTGTGGAPVIAEVAKKLGILTVGIVTMPFKVEGRLRTEQALAGIEELRKHVDSLLLINNENIREIYGDLPITEAFGHADDILATAAKGIAEIITRPSLINVDFADVKSVMAESGVALMGSARASGANRVAAVSNAVLASPLLNHNDIHGAQNILVNITSGTRELTMDETYQILELIQSRAGIENSASIIFGTGTDELLGDDIEVTIVATGFDVDALSQSSHPSLKVPSGVQEGQIPTRNEVQRPATVPQQPVPVRVAEPEPVIDIMNVLDPVEEIIPQPVVDKEIVKMLERPAWLRRGLRMIAPKENSDSQNLELGDDAARRRKVKRAATNDANLFGNE